MVFPKLIDFALSCPLLGHNLRSSAYKPLTLKLTFVLGWIKHEKTTSCLMAGGSFNRGQSVKAPPAGQCLYLSVM